MEICSQYERTSYFQVQRMHLTTPLHMTQAQPCAFSDFTLPLLKVGRSAYCNNLCCG
jgi:hypothetical protein